jgi:hypothetical protein
MRLTVDLQFGPMVVIAASSLTLLSISGSLLFVRVLQRACAIVGAVRMRALRIRDVL